MTFYQSKKRIPPSMLSCSICPQRYECIRCSSLSQVDPKHPEKLRDLVVRNIYRIPASPEDQARMDNGTEAHLILEQMRRVDSDPESVIRRIRNRETFYFLLSFCTVRYGFRGTVDAVLAEWKGNTLKLTVIDDKPFVAKKYFKQIYAYAMMLSDPNCLYTRSMDGEGEEIERRPFWPEIGDDYDSVEIWTTLNPYRDHDRVLNRPLEARLFSRARVFVNKGLVFAVLRTRRKIIEAYAEPALLAATQQMKFKRSGNQLVLYEPTVRR